MRRRPRSTTPQASRPASGGRCWPTDPINLTDEASRIMPVAGGGVEQCYNAQAVVAADSLLVIAAQVVQAPNDKQQIDPILERIGTLPEDLGKPETLLADTGHFSEANVALCAAAQIDPICAGPPVALNRQIRRSIGCGISSRRGQAGTISMFCRRPLETGERRREPSPPAIPANGSGGCRTADFVALRVGASLSGATGAYDRSVRARRERHGRIIAQRLSEQIGKQFYVENISGAGGNIGVGRAALAAPDGYTILVTPPSYVINPALYDKIPYDARKSFDPVTLAVSTTVVLAVHPSVLAQTVKDLVALIKTQSRQIQLRDGRSGVARTSGGRNVTSVARPRPCTYTVQQRGLGDRLNGRV